MKCTNCNRSVRDENAVIEMRVIREYDRSGVMTGSYTKTTIYGPSCAKRLGIVAVKPAREKRPRKVRIARKVEIDSDTADLFEGMV